MAADDQGPKAGDKDDRAARAAAALRENLRKRKTQQRERAEHAATVHEGVVDDEKEWGK